MGLLNSLKKVLNLQEGEKRNDDVPRMEPNRKMNGNDTAQNGESVLIPIPGNIEDNVLINSLTNSLDSYRTVRGIPKEIIELMWFRDGPLKNIDPEPRFIHKTEAFTIKISFPGSIEPSAIGVTDTIRPPMDGMVVERPPYYPTYERMTPEQRWVYLSWLINVDKEVNIGYVFVFYYGLERHLFLGHYEAAFDMILRLRRVHRNSSFLSYSSNALIATCVIHNRPDLFVRFLQSLVEITDEDVNPMYLLAKRSLGLELEPEEIMLLAREVGFTNKRYLEGESALFKDELKKRMVQVLGRDMIDLRPLALNDTPTRPVMFSANFSLPDEQRVVHIPDLSQNKAFRALVYRLLLDTHDVVKERMKELRKADKTSDAEMSNEPELPIPCPYCNNSTKPPKTKRVCPSCKKIIVARTDPDSKKRVFVTEEGAAKIDARKKDLQAIRFAVKCMWPFGMTAEQLERMTGEMREKAPCSVNDVVWKIVNTSMQKWEAEGTIPSQYCYLAMANFLEFEGKDKGEMMAKYQEEDRKEMEKRYESLTHSR